MRLLKILIALCLIRNSLQMVKFYEEKTILVNQISCVNKALKMYLDDVRDIWMFSTKSISPVNILIKVPLIVFTDWDLMRGKPLVKKGAVVIFLEGKVDQDFNELKRLQDIVMVRPILIACITDVVCSSDIYMNRIAAMMRSAELYYVAIDEKGVIGIHEYTTTAEGNCGIAQLLRVGSCSDKSTVEKIFTTSVNFHECPIRVVTWPYPPYSILCSSGYQSNRLCGFSGNVVQIVSQYVNATPVLLVVEDPKGELNTTLRVLEFPHAFGGISTQPAVYLSVHHVASGHADLGFGELDNRPFEGITYSTPYMIVQAALVAPHSVWTLERSVGNILQPLEAKVWMGVGIVIVSVLILRRLVPTFGRIYILQLFGIILGHPVPRQPRGVHIRIYFLSLVLFGYLCSQSYLTNLTKVLTTPQRQMMKTLNDVENSKLRVSGTAAEREKFKDDYPRIYKDFKVDKESEYYSNIYKLTEGNSNLVYYVEDLDRNIAEWKNVEALHDTFNWFPIALAVPNTSAVLRVSNEILMSVVQSGILNAHISLSSPMYRFPKYCAASSSSETSSELRFNELKGVFFLLIGGLLFSSLVFLIEIIAAFVKKRKECNMGSRTADQYQSRQRPT